MVHEKLIDSVLERSFLLLCLLALWPARLDAQELKLSRAFLEARASTHQNTFDTAVGPVASVSNNAIIQNLAAPVYDVIALRVSFQADTSRFTTGDGLFDGVLFDALESNVDPLPHDAAYFNAHLQFLSNYVEKVSDGNTHLNIHLIPEVIQLSQKMAAYSPTGFDAGSDDELRKLATLVWEAWTLADQQSSFDMSGFDPQNTALILFHAGVGRDIELVGTSLDKTPHDLPTIFFNNESFKRLLPDTQIDFNGFPVRHTILMPRTESRPGFDFIQDVPFLVEFSINGLLAASFFNFLGVPDLFNTSTGETAIGPFGLMDPLGLFAYNGLFPPEPGAWTKLYLGWEEPVIYTGEEKESIQLIAAGGDTPQELVQVPISASEYFLVENRNRDIDDDGLMLTIYRDGQTVTQQVENGQEDFNSFNIDGFEGGVVIDADDYDWALPGGIDEDGNDLIGGIAIWHIDERILAQGLPLNQVNVDPRQRAIDLEEADGAQDIGFPSDNIFGPQAFLGTPFDFFYEGNPVVVITSSGEEVRLYTNEFGPATYPNSNSNAGGPSFVVLDEFSLPGPSMSFNARRESNAGVQPIHGFPELELAEVPTGSYVAFFTGPSTNVVFQSNDAEIALSALEETTPSLISSQFIKSPITLPGGKLAAIEANEQGEASLLYIENGERSSIPLGVDIRRTPAFYSHLLYHNLENRFIALIDNVSGSSVLQIDLDPNIKFQLTTLSNLAQAYSIAVTKKGEIAILSSNGVECSRCEHDWQFSVGEDANVGQLVLAEGETGLIGAYTDIARELLVYLLADGSINEIDLTQFNPAGRPDGVNRFPVLTDLDKDGRLEALLTYGSKLMAFHAGGGMADGFPIEMSATASTQPLIVSMKGIEGRIVLVGTSDGYIHAYPVNSKIQIAGFPLAVGSNITASPAIKEKTLFAVDFSGAIKAWELENLTRVWWGKQNVNVYNTNFVEAEEVLESASRAGGGSLFVSENNYNWPNPIRNGETFFRLAPSEDVRVTITIIDAAGGLIDKLVLENVRGDTETDVRWQTDASSGLYYARVKATSGDGTSETTLIKMAIVR